MNSQETSGNHGYPAPPVRPAGAVGLLEAVRGALAETALPLALPDAAHARQDIRSALAQLDDYILPRYRSLDAPLLAVVGGSTGAGKSTLVNALVGHAVTPGPVPSVLRRASRSCSTTPRTAPGSRT
ncbi:ribosome biogenesis GTPase A [Arthrobacter sp. B3I9]|nr:ribosome biogenesis GTPase A [Arthrobacter sp. B3I9]